MRTADTVSGYFDQIVQTTPSACEEAYWVAWIDGAANRTRAIEDMVEVLLLRVNDARSVLYLHMSFFDRPPEQGQLDALVGMYRRLRKSHPALTKKKAIIQTIRHWLASERVRLKGVNEFSEDDFRAILFLKLLFGTM